MLSKKRIDHFHIIRGLAALMVVFFHSRFILWCGGKEYTKLSHPIIQKILTYAGMIFFSAGSSMVICFFVLSGFFMQLSFSSNTIKQFYLNRIIRIYIPYVANTIITCLILFICFNYINPHLKIPFNSSEIATTPLEAYKELNISNFLRSLLFLPQKQYIAWNKEYWSLLFEAIFYLTIPILVIRKLFTLLLAVLAFIIGCFYSADGVFLQYILNYLIFFQAGICLHLIIDHVSIENIFKRVKGLYIIIICLMLYTASSVLALLHQERLAFIVGGILSVILMLFFYHQPDYIFKRKCYKWLKGLGEISYSLYLTHYLLLYLIYTVITRVWGVYVIYPPYYILSVIILIPFSIVFYRAIEKPSLLLKTVFTLKNKVAKS